jgi:nucleoside-diphosphate-sugar epimerase
VTRSVLVTGADGYLGLRSVQRFLADTDDRLILSVRAADSSELDAKRARLALNLGAAARSRTQVVPADLTADAPLAAVATDVECIVHAAARTNFDIERETARQVNTVATARVAEFAMTCPRLERFLFMSTLVSVGCRTGDIGEAITEDAAEHANHYEWSKEQAERDLVRGFSQLPWSIVRLPTIIADDDSGRVTQYNAFHNTLKMMFYGLLSLMPGLPDTPLYLATAEFTARGVVRLAQSQVEGGVYHLAPAAEEAVSLGDVMDVVFDTFQRDPAFARRRLLRPEFCDRDTFRFMVAASRGLGASPSAGALRSVAPFSEQMFHPKRFDNSRLRASWPDMPAASGLALVAATCQTLIRTRWGRGTKVTGANPAAVPA